MKEVDLICDYDVNDDECEILNGDEITENEIKENVFLNELEIKEVGNKNDNVEKCNLSEELRSIVSKLTALTVDEKTRLLSLLTLKRDLFIEKQRGGGKWV